MKYIIAIVILYVCVFIYAITPVQEVHETNTGGQDDIGVSLPMHVNTGHQTTVSPQTTSPGTELQGSQPGGLKPMK